MNYALHELLDNIINDVASEKTVHPRRPPASWFIPEIRDLQNRPDSLYRIFRRTGYAYKEYSNVRRLLKQRLTKEKKKYFDQQLSSAKNSRALWNDLRRLGLIKSKSAQQLLRVDINELNDYFINSTNSANWSEVVTDDIVLGDINNNNEYFYFRELNMESVKRSIMRLLSCSVGPDNFSIKAYKCVLPYFLPWFTELFNMSLATGEFPTKWKLSHVVPIPKVPHPVDCVDYRPISLLSNLSKALERCVYDQIVDYINANNYTDKYQLAYKDGLNTQTAVIKLCDDICLAIDEHKVTIAVFFYLSKAFDTVSHQRLLRKLLSMNISDEATDGLDHIYLKGVSQFAIIITAQRGEKF
ncbi:uncharacterized protein LOC141525691 [Cotesia typhae]|uniref:uncharacterized protein LOC141525691 n=1 Tax=Cotesia typhae TaxID=2053667 RepID=UPI003D686BC9